MLNKIIKILIIIVLFLVIIILVKFRSDQIAPKRTWEFVGYQYRWNKDYVSNDGFESEIDCVRFGNNWIQQQDLSGALYTCSTDCEAYVGEVEVCKKVCEYDTKGLIKCR